ncbi:unnamed protein product [Arctogadus glacialis]
MRSPGLTGCVCRGKELTSTSPSSFWSSLCPPPGHLPPRPPQPPPLTWVGGREGVESFPLPVSSLHAQDTHAHTHKHTHTHYFTHTFTHTRTQPGEPAPPPPSLPTPHKHVVIVVHIYLQPSTLFNDSINR